MASEGLLSTELERIAGLGVWRLHLGTGRLEWSDGMFAIMGKDPSDFTGTVDDMMGLVARSDIERVAAGMVADLDATRVDDAACGAEFTIVRQDGTRRVLLSLGLEARRTDDGPVVTGVLVDVTERDRARERDLAWVTTMNALADRALRLVRYAGSDRLHREVAEGLLSFVDGPACVAVVEVGDDGILVPRAGAHTGGRGLERLSASLGAVPMRWDRRLETALRSGRLQSVFLGDLGGAAAEEAIRAVPDDIGFDGRVHLLGAVRDDAVVCAFVIARFGEAAPLEEDLLRAYASQAAIAVGWHRTLQALRANEARIRGLLDALPDQIFRQSRDGVFLDYWGGARPDTIAPPEQFLGRSLDEVLPPSAAERLKDGIDRAVATGRLQIIEYCLSGPNGDGIFEARMQPVGQEVVSIVRDVTDRRRALAAEAALEDSRRQLRAAQRMEAVGRLAGGVAHDFNNVLTVVNSHVHLLLESLPEGDPRREHAEQIAAAARRAASLTSQLLTFGRRHVVRAEVLDLYEVTAELQDMLGRLIGDDIALSVRGEAGAWVRADRGQMEQVLLNLAVNARDAMPTGGRLDISVDTVELDEDGASSAGVRPGKYVSLEVADTGVGMDAPTAARIFEPFFSTKGIDRGTGLGLSTVYGIVRQAGGAISVDTAIGAGARFRILLPALDEGCAAPEAVAEPPSERPSPGRVVLVVEDEPEVREVVSRILGKAGYTVVSLEVDAAFSYEGPVDLLLTDVVMPGTSGPVLAAALTARRRGLPVLYMTGYTDDLVVQHGIREGDAAVLRKPFSAEALLAAVHDAIAAAEAEGERYLLLVDDEPAMRSLLMRILAREGFEVRAAGSGLEALEVVQAAGRPPDLVITDVTMAGMDGFTLLERLRVRWPDLPALIVSGAPVGRRGPLDHPLLKPFRPSELLEAVRALL